MKINRSGHRVALGGVVAGCLLLTACGSGFDGDEASGQGGDDKLTVLIWSSTDAEARAVKDSVAAWSDESGSEAEVLVASDLPQQLSQGFAANTPPDVFYLPPDQVAGYAANGSLYAYGSELSNADAFYPSLTQAFTVDGKLQCAPKDFSTLGLVINEKLWKDAGLTDADTPTDWDQLATVAAELTQGDVVGLSMSGDIGRSAPSSRRRVVLSPTTTGARPPSTARRTSRRSSTSRAC
jgi:multiple sugar transport system substrate-binding protein